MKYFVEYNGKYIAEYKTLKGANDFITKKGLKNDDDNLLLIVDNEGGMYRPTGELEYKVSYYTGLQNRVVYFSTVEQAREFIKTLDVHTNEPTMYKYDETLETYTLHNDF